MRASAPHRVSLLLLLAGALSWTGAADARLYPVPASEGSVQRAASEAGAGDTLLLARGIHRGPLVLRSRITLRGEPGAVLDGGGRGTVLGVEADGCRIEDLTIRSSGRRVLTADSGVRVTGAGHVTLSGLRLDDVLYGVYAERAASIVIDSCEITGTAAPGSEIGEGNGIHLWYCESPTVRGCSVERFADAAYLSFTTGATFEDSRFEWNTRYGFHTMYCQSNRLTRNRFAHNMAGCAIMFSNRLVIERNDFVHNRGPRTYGLLLRDCSDGAFETNRLVDNTIAVFMDDSNRNRFTGNLVQDNGWGVLLYSSSDGNEFAGNSFVNNDYPVALDMRYTQNRFDNGRLGNYWSENAAYDLDGDRVSDVPYSPVSAFAFLSKQYPDLSVLAHSPAVAALGIAERVVPALRPSEAVDRFPLVRPAGSNDDRAALREIVVEPDWLHGTGFFALGALGALGLIRGRRVR